MGVFQGLFDFLHIGRNSDMPKTCGQLGRPTTRPESFEVKQAVEEVCSVVTYLAQKKNISIHREVDAAVRAVTLDLQKFKQVLLNLLSNAVKFTNDGGTVNILVNPHEQNRLRLQVRDTGIGIKGGGPGETLHRISATRFGRKPAV
jgi:signal transduction histidine kinase